MNSATTYRVLLDRFFVLNDLENCAVLNLRKARAMMMADAEAVSRFREELELIRDEKMRLFARLQAVLLTTGTAPLTASQRI